MRSRLHCAYGISVALAAFGVVHMVGCSQAADPTTTSTGTQQAALIGAPLDTTHTFSMGLCYGGLVTGDAGNAGSCASGRCSSTLIAPNVVLTARHCVQNPKPSTTFCNNDGWDTMRDVTKFRVTTAATVNDTTAVWHEVDEVKTPPTNRFCEDDVVALVLKTNVDGSAATPVEVDLTRNLATSSPTHVSVVGRGLIAAAFDVDAGTIINPDNGGRQRRVLDTIPFLCASDVDLTCKVADFSSPPSNEFSAPAGIFLFGASLLSGDSGGGIFDKATFTTSTPKLIGVGTAGTWDGTGAPNASLGVRMPQHAAWLSDAVKVAAVKGGYTVPAWAAAVNDAGSDAASDASTADAAKPVDAAVQPPAEDASVSTPKPDAAPTTPGSSSSAGASEDDGGCSISGTPKSQGGFAAIALGTAALLGVRRRRR